MSALVECDACQKTFKNVHGLRCHKGRMHKNTPVAPPTATDEDRPDLLTEIKLLRKSSRIVRRIPNCLRISIAQELCKVLRDCALQNTTETWTRLLTFAHRVLDSSSLDNNKSSLTSALRTNLKLWQEGKHRLEPDTTARPNSKKGKPKVTTENDLEERLTRLAHQKLFDGDVSGAVRILSSSETIAPESQETHDALVLKHPPLSAPLNPPAPTPGIHLTVDAKEVSVFIRRFKTASSAGLDGLRPIHLRDLTAPHTGDAGQQLLEALTSVTNIMLSGLVPAEVCPFLYGATLIALKKKCGGIRPIAIGSVFRRLAAKLGCASVVDTLRPYLQPHQMGFGTPGGAEAVHRAMRIFLQGKKGLMCKLDVKNAFNTVHRGEVLMAALEMIPSLYALIHQAYANSSHLLFGDFVIESAEGVQQGDPLGPALYCLATQPIIADLSSEVNAAYLDDESLASADPSLVATDVETVLSSSAAIGLELNPAKCELFVLDNTNPAAVEKITRLLHGIKILEPSECELLGAPLTDEAIPAALEAKIRQIKLLTSRLPLLKSHAALYILKNCLGIPKMTYLLRCIPSWKFPELLASFDAVIREALESIVNGSINDQAWFQASLPVARGGLGIRSAQPLSYTAFLASIASTTDLVNSILGSPHEDPDRPEALAQWSAMTNSSPEPVSNLQSEWDRPVLNQLSASLLNSAETPRDRARILASTRSEAGGWLNALPSPNLGTLLDDSPTTIAVCLRLGLPLCHPHRCRGCGGNVDEDGTHGLSCVNVVAPGRNARHAAINEILKRACGSANIPAILEPTGTFRDDGKRPDGLTLIPWAKGKCLLWDATCADTLAVSHLDSTSRSAGAAAQSREQNKRRKYQGVAHLYKFCPFGVETLGPFGEEALALVKDIGGRMHAATGEPRSRSFLVQRISLAIQRGNATCVLATIPYYTKLNEIFNL